MVGESETIRAMAEAPGYGPSADSSASYAIDPPADYSLAIAPASLTLNPGQSAATTTVSVSPQNGFDSAVQLACSGLPSGASCQFSPAVVTPAGAGPARAKLTVASTTSPMLRRVSGAAMPVSTFVAVFWCWRSRRREAFKMICFALACAIGLAALTGCAGFTVRSQGALVTSTVTVTAQAGSLQHAATLSLTAP
jgi:hypothetical protein